MAGGESLQVFGNGEHVPPVQELLANLPFENGKVVRVGISVEVTGKNELLGGFPLIQISHLSTGPGSSIGGYLIDDDPPACGLPHI